MPSSALSILFQHKQFLEPYPCHALRHLKHLDSYLMHGFLGQSSPHPKRHLDRLSSAIFVGSRSLQTDHAAPSAGYSNYYFTIIIYLNQTTTIHSYK